jgi:hypothetical protein
MPKCTNVRIDFGRVGRRVVEADFSGGDPSCDGVAPLLGPVDDSLGLTRAAARALGDERRGRRVVHSLHGMVAHRVHGLHQGGPACAPFRSHDLDAAPSATGFSKRQGSDPTPATYTLYGSGGAAMITRKTFVARLAAWAGGGSALWLAGCGGGGGDDSAMPGLSACAATEITGNHGHQLSIAPADLDSPTAMTYGIRGAADHDHLVTFSADQLARLKSGQSVTVTSTVTFGHSHAVTEACS